MTTESSNKNNTVLIIILVILGVIAVFAIGILLGNIFGGSEEIVTPPTPEPGDPYLVTTDYVNVRSGPSVQYPIYGVVPPGTAAEISGKSEDGGWWQIKIPTEYVASGEGWVSAEYSQAYGAENVPVVPAPPLEEVEIPTPVPGVSTAVATAAINVRSGPSTDYPSYGVAPEGTVFEVVGVSEDGGWWVVSIPTQYVGTGQGWVSDDHVKTENTDGVPVVPAP